MKDGVVKIRLVEARLGGISISGDKWLSKSFVMDRIHQKPGDLLSVDQLEQDLVRFNTLYDAKLRANLAAGVEAGKTDLSLEVAEPPRYSLSTFFNNSGSYSTGLGRGGVILGVNDDVTVGLTQPFAVSLNRQFAAYGRISSRNSLTQFSGITQQEQDLTVMATGLSAEAHYDDVAWTLDNSPNFGAKTLGGDASFTYYRLNASRVDSLSERFSLVTRLGAQYSFDKQLPSSEQF